MPDPVNFRSPGLTDAFARARLELLAFDDAQRLELLQALENEFRVLDDRTELSETQRTAWFDRTIGRGRSGSRHRRARAPRSDPVAAARR